MNSIPTETFETLLQPALTRAKTGPLIEMGDHRGYVLLDSAQTGGAFAAIYLEANFNGGPPVPHYHTREDETFYILEGLFEVEIDDQIIEVGPGDTAFAPRYIPHNWRCVDENGGKAIAIITPGGFEQFLAELAEMLPPAGPEDIAKMNRHFQNYGVVPVPPVK